jgi:hypothetical protein
LAQYRSADYGVMKIARQQVVIVAEKIGPYFFSFNFRLDLYRVFVDDSLRYIRGMTGIDIIIDKLTNSRSRKFSNLYNQNAPNEG